MQWLVVMLVSLAFANLGVANDSRLLLRQMSSEEQKQVLQQIDDVLKEPVDGVFDLIPMSRSFRLYDPAKQQWVNHAHPVLADGKASKSKDPLIRQMGKRATAEFQRQYCEKFLKRKFPALRCDVKGGRAPIEANDRVENLVSTWIGDSSGVKSIEHDLKKLPVKGQAEASAWSDDYWRLTRGATSYRYGEGKDFNNWTEVIRSYEQPAQWRGLVGQLASVKEIETKIQQAIRHWSPAEKYDLAVGDEAFTLMQEQRQEGAYYSKQYKNLSEWSWMGICHGWAAASIIVPAPVRPVTVTGPRDLRVTLNPHDIRALVSLAWANGESQSNFIGGRCNINNPATSRFNGRLIQQECFDTNPATLHLAVTNLIGRAKVAMVADHSFSAEVWNNPMVRYSLTFFNPVTKAMSAKLDKSVLVDFNDKGFVKVDRFRHPKFNTRGKNVDKVVGVTLTVDYVNEVSPAIGNRPAENEYLRATYVYDLELIEKNGAYAITGGEYYSNQHPDFLWVPQRNAVALSAWDVGAGRVEYKGTPTEALTRVAQNASGRGSPLCEVVAHMVRESTEEKYVCQAR